ncbi:hypothetical protein ACN267_22010 [Micromonospora sp. WMMD734]|uniref:hypothetical protein n=1 Tax=Micromonospora sp. WMMD734 TaxID=3404129 RepID=UPI003B928052
MTHTLASCHRLLDVIGYVESDPRVQVVFTIAPDVFNHRVEQLLDGLGALVLPWQQGEHQELVVVASTWGPEGSFGRWPDLLPQVMAQLPAERYRVAALLHPAIWAAHGHRQIRAWLRNCLDAGLLLPEPTEDWRAPVVAADHVIGDHGSVTAYAAAVGRPTLVLPAPEPAPAPGTPQHLLALHAPRLDLHRPLLPQLALTGRIDPAAVLGALTARPGDAAELLRRTMYRLLQLTEPDRPARTDPVPVPRPDHRDTDPNG